MNRISIFEHERVKTLQKYQLLDNATDKSFDRITKLAAKILDVPIAIFTLVDTDRIWFKSRYGLDVKECSRDPGLCDSAILSDGIYTVEDATLDPRTRANPLVTGSLGFRFYCAMPIKVENGHNLGTLCVIDKHPRVLTESQKETLSYLAHILVDQLELRLAALNTTHEHKEVLRIAAHNLKNPLTAIRLWADLAVMEKDNPVKVGRMYQRIQESCKQMERLLSGLLEARK